MSDYKDLETLVIGWAKERGILDSSMPSKQLGKLLEELGELVAARTQADEIDAVGDVMVCLILYCELAGLSLQTCLGAAYDEIKDRKGKMVNGVFVKES